MFEDAVARHRAGNLAGAEAGYLEVLERVPEHPHALHFLGVALHQQRRYPEALSRLEQAAKALPRAPAVHSNLGNTLRALGRHPQAILAYEKALDLDPKFADASNNLGITLQELKRPDAAVEAYRQALAAGGGVNVSRNLASALRQARRFEEARAVCRAALDAHPDDAEMHRVLGNLELDLGHWTDAASSLERARELGAEDGDLLLSLGHALRKAKQRDRALEIGRATCRERV